MLSARGSDDVPTVEALRDGRETKTIIVRYGRAAARDSNGPLRTIGRTRGHEKTQIDSHQVLPKDAPSSVTTSGPSIQSRLIGVIP